MIQLKKSTWGWAGAALAAAGCAGLGLRAPAGGCGSRSREAGSLRAIHRRGRPHAAEGPVHRLRAGGVAAGPHHPARGRQRGGRRHRRAAHARHVVHGGRAQPHRGDGAAEGRRGRRRARRSPHRQGPHRAAGSTAGTGPLRKAGGRRLHRRIAPGRRAAGHRQRPARDSTWPWPNARWRCTSRPQAAAALQPRGRRRARPVR